VSWEEQPTVDLAAAEAPADNGSPPDQAAPRSSLEAIRSRRTELARRKTLDLLVPGYEDLGVRYQPVPDEEFDKLVARIQAAGAGSSNVDAACDLLSHSCEAILYRAEGGPLEPLTDDAGVPLGFDTRLAELLGFEAQTARAVIRGVFSPDGTAPLAPGLHAMAVVEWMQGNEAAIDRALLGE
jgi:hypothetical protein